MPSSLIVTVNINRPIALAPKTQNEKMSSRPTTLNGCERISVIGNPIKNNASVNGIRPKVFMMHSRL